MPEHDLHVVVGAGPVGRAVIGELVRRGLRVRAIARHSVAELPAGVETLLADITDPTAAVRAMASAAVVYHAASAPYHRWPELLPHSCMESSPAQRRLARRSSTPTTCMRTAQSMGR